MIDIKNIQHGDYTKNELEMLKRREYAYCVQSDQYIFILQQEDFNMMMDETKFDEARSIKIIETIKEQQSHIEQHRENIEHLERLINTPTTNTNTNTTTNTNINPQEVEMTNRSVAYHNHPSHPSDCGTYREHYGKRCPCETYVKPTPKPTTTRLWIGILIQDDTQEVVSNGTDYKSVSAETQRAYDEIDSPISSNAQWFVVSTTVTI